VKYKKYELKIKKKKKKKKPPAGALLSQTPLLAGATSYLRFHSC